jgi:hypothetical protein
MDTGATIEFALRGTYFHESLKVSLALSIVLFIFLSFRRKKASNLLAYIKAFFTDFWFDRFIAPGFLTLLLLGCFIFFLAVIFFLFACISSGIIRWSAVAEILLINLTFFAATRIALESVVALEKSADATQMILKMVSEKQRDSDQ